MDVNVSQVIVRHLMWVSILSYCVGNLAKLKGRNFWVWGALSFIFSPIVTAIVLLFLKDLSVAETEQIEEEVK